MNWSHSDGGGGDSVVDGAGSDGGGGDGGGGDGGGGDGGGGDGRGGVGHGGVRMLVSLCVYTGWRFLFLIVGITLPLPCGVFAPTLAIGAGIGRLRHLLPRLEWAGSRGGE